MIIRLCKISHPDTNVKFSILDLHKHPNIWRSQMSMNAVTGWFGKSETSTRIKWVWGESFFADTFDKEL